MYRSFAGPLTGGAPFEAITKVAFARIYRTATVTAVATLLQAVVQGVPTE